MLVYFESAINEAFTDENKDLSKGGRLAYDIQGFIDTKPVQTFR